MMYKTERNQPYQDCQKVQIMIGGIQYTLRETKEGRLEINKIDTDLVSNEISIIPYATNQIEII